MTTLNIKFDVSTATRFPVYAQFGGQCMPQPAFLELDIRDGSLTADYSGEVGNGVPGAVWHGRILRFKLMPETTADQIERIINDNVELFQKILDGSEDVWNGSNWVGKFSDEATNIIEQINQQDLFVCEAEGGMIELASWIEDKPFPTGSESVEAFAQGVIDTDGMNGFYFREPYNIDSLLSDLRDIWGDLLYSGTDIPAVVAQHLVEHGTCDNSAWMDELREFASAE